ncbi:hypothetical protein ACJRO7_031878, partial [Eucalyptus globulus]
MEMRGLTRCMRLQLGNFIEQHLVMVVTGQLRGRCQRHDEDDAGDALPNNSRGVTVYPVKLEK